MQESFRSNSTKHNVYLTERFLNVNALSFNIFFLREFSHEKYFFQNFYFDISFSLRGGVKWLNARINENIFQKWLSFFTKLQLDKQGKLPGVNPMKIRSVIFTPA